MSILKSDFACIFNGILQRTDDRFAMRMVIFLGLLVLTAACSESPKAKAPKAKLHSIIVEQNDDYVEAALLELRNHYTEDELSQYVFHDTIADFRKGDDGETVGRVAVVFEKIGTRTRTKTGENSYTIYFDRLGVTFELFDRYKRIEMTMCEDEKYRTKEIFVEHY